MAKKAITKKRGPAPKPDAQQRTEQVRIRLTPNEKKKITRNAKKFKLTPTEYLRSIGLSVGWMKGLGQPGSTTDSTT